MITFEQPSSAGTIVESIAASEGEYTVIRKVKTSAVRISKGADPSSTALKTLADSLLNLTPEAATVTTRYLSNVSYRDSDVDGIPIDLWLKKTVAPFDYDCDTGKDDYTQMRLYALSAKLGQGQSSETLLG